jgi:two-component system response regulator VicR
MTKVLIVEDNISLNKVYSLVLQKEGYEVTSAFDGRDGIKQLATLEPDLILLDMLMPHMGGLEFLKRFPFSDHPGVRVVMLSNVNEDKDVSQALKLGAANYIVKSDNSPKDLVERLSEIIG